MIIPRLGYDVRKGSRAPPDVEIPPDDAEEDAGYSCIEGTCEMPTIAPSGDSNRTTV